MDQNDQTLLQNYPWLNDNLFHEIIQKEYPQNPVTIKCWTGKAALSAGENYASQMIRIRVTFSTEDENGNVVEKEMRFIAKAEILEGDLSEFVKETNIFKREIAMYRDILPEVERLLCDAGDYTKLGARCFASCETTPYLIFEDLTADGFRNTSRLNGMNVDHYKVLFTKLAKFHAGTAVLLDNLGKEHQFFDSIRESIQLHERADVYIKFVRNSISMTANLLKTKYGSIEFAEKLERNIDLLIDKCSKCFIPDDNTFNVIIHSDLWSNNIMFKFDADTNVPIEAMMVDYQICFYGPVVLDLGYTLFTSSANNLRDGDWDQLIQYYYETLIMTLKKLNYSRPLPMLIDIHVQFLQRAIVNAFISIFVTGIRQLENADEKTSSAFFNDTDEARQIRLDILSNPNCEKGLDFLVDYFTRKGLFE